MPTMISGGLVKDAVRRVRWMQQNRPGGDAGALTVQRGGSISNALTGINPRANPAERSDDETNALGPRRRRPIGPRRGYGRGLGGRVSSVFQRP